jgi:hypothetical protein
MTKQSAPLCVFSTRLPWTYCFLPVPVVLVALGAACLLARQASEQYLTSSQFFAQLLRHVISRPQTMQTLLGSDALLPLKPIVKARYPRVLW